MNDNGDSTTYTRPTGQLRLTPTRLTISALVVLTFFEAGRTVAFQLVGPFLANQLAGDSSALWQGPYAPGLLVAHLLALLVGAGVAGAIAVPVVNKLLR